MGLLYSQACCVWEFSNPFIHLLPKLCWLWHVFGRWRHPNFLCCPIMQQETPKKHGIHSKGVTVYFGLWLARLGAKMVQRQDSGSVSFFRCLPQSWAPAPSVVELELDGAIFSGSKSSFSFRIQIESVGWSSASVGHSWLKGHNLGDMNLEAVGQRWVH